MTANERQEYGDHYHTSFQHWDLVEAHRLGYLEGCATKYITRWRKKNGLQDLDKAAHYLEKLAELHLAGKREPSGWASGAEVFKYAQANDLLVSEEEFIRLLCQWESITELTAAAAIINTLRVQAKAIEEAAPA